MSKILLHIITPVGEVYTGKIGELTVPTLAGIITVLPNHIPLLSVLRSGELIIRAAGVQTPFAVFGGTIEVRKSSDDITEVVVLADRSEKAAEIDTERAEAAYKRAKDLADGLHAEHADFARFEAMMDKELNRINVGSKYR